MRSLLFAILLAPAVTSAQLPALPDSVPTALGWVPVRQVPNLKCLQNGEQVMAYGCVNPLDRVILIRAGMPPTMAWLSLEHERAHLTIFDGGLRLPADIEEMLARILSAARVAEMLAERKRP